VVTLMSNKDVVVGIFALMIGMTHSLLDLDLNMGGSIWIVKGLFGLKLCIFWCS
jgi:hypothetical protein